MSSTLVLSDVGDETWGAVLENGQVVELQVENAGRPGIAGNIYRGRVSRVLPGTQSAFIDIGIGRDAFLRSGDLRVARQEEIVAEPEDAAGGPHFEGPAPVRIQDHLREGQEILVQVAKEPMAAKSARVTARIALPGRVLVLLPYTSRVFVSRRIEDASERERLRALAGQSKTGREGWIVRTAGEGASEAVIQRDAAYLLALWKSIQETNGKGGAPLLIHRDLTVGERLLRDAVSEEFEAVIVDSDRLRHVATAFMDGYLPRLRDRIRQVPEGGPLFDELGIHQEIERALRSRLWLKGGGSIVVNPTEALVAIDVNSGKDVRGDGLEGTALRTNLEAVREIVRLLRLRDLGGIIVIDFIDMAESRHREMLFETLSGELRKDRSRTRLLTMSDFGLVQLTRKRTRRSLDRALQVPCPSCGGGGRIRSALALYYEIQRELARAAPLAGPQGPLVRLSPAAMDRMQEEGLHLRLPRTSDSRDRDRSVRLQPDPGLSEERYEIVW